MNKSGRNLIKDLVGEDKAKEARIYYLRSYAQNIGRLKLKDSVIEALETARNLGFANVLSQSQRIIFVFFILSPFVFAR